MSSSKRKSVSVTAMTFLAVLIAAVVAVPAQAESLDLSDSALEGISAQGISTGGDFSTSCTTSSSSICIGTYEWNDNHQFDSSSNKGSIVMSGYVQQNVTANTNMSSTQSAVATGVNTIGDISLSNSTINLTNMNNATNFVGGF